MVQSLRIFLLNKRVELYERVNRLKDVILSEDFTEIDRLNLEHAESELNLIKSIIEICARRSRF